MELSGRIKKLEACLGDRVADAGALRAVRLWLAGKGPPPTCERTIIVPPIYGEPPDPSVLTMIVRDEHDVPHLVRGPRHVRGGPQTWDGAVA